MYSFNPSTYSAKMPAIGVVMRVVAWRLSA